MSAPEVVTLGCRLNAFESEVMRRSAQAAGLTDAVIVNTCAVTAEAERQARQTIRNLKRTRPGARIIVSGCAAQLDPNRFAAMDEVDSVLGNREKLDPASYGAAPLDDPIRVSDVMAAREAGVPLVDQMEGRSRAFVQVQQGCDHRCTFCIIPFARGNSRSVPEDQVIAQVRALVESGYREAVLTGVDISSYGRETGDERSLGALVHRILDEVPDLARLRLSSLDPAVADDALFAALADEDRLMPHLHLSIQAGSDMVLKRMKRRHDRDGARRFCERARAARPDTVFGADLIAGFPTETEEMFSETLALVADAGLTYLHVFPYSPRPGTPAARMPRVTPKTAKARASRLREAGDAARAAFFETTVGHDVEILVEKDGRGYTPHYAPVCLSAGADNGAIGKIVRARITGHDGKTLIADLAS